MIIKNYDYIYDYTISNLVEIIDLVWRTIKSWIDINMWSYFMLFNLFDKLWQFQLNWKSIFIKVIKII
jgi:hypothetical protein